jgi:hypothetical protein
MLADPTKRSIATPPRHWRTQTAAIESDLGTGGSLAP